MIEPLVDRKKQGVSQSNVSRWETGGTIPTTERLLVLYQLAENSEEKQVIVSAIRRSLGEPGPSEDDLRQVIEEIQHLIDQPPVEQGPATREDMLVWFVDLYAKYCAETDLLECFSEGLAYIETSIRLKKGQHLTPDLKFQARFQDADADELKVIDDMLAVYRAGDPIVADIRRAALVLRKRERSTPMPKVTARRNR